MDHLQRKHPTHQKSLPIFLQSSSTGQPLIYFLPLYMLLFWTFYISEIIKYVAFHNMFHLAKCFQGLSMVACLSTSSHFVDNISFYEYITFFHPFSNWWTFGVVFAFWLLWTFVYNLWVSVCVYYVCDVFVKIEFQLFWVYNKEWIFSLMVTVLNLFRNCQ